MPESKGRFRIQPSSVGIDSNIVDPSSAQAEIVEDKNEGTPLSVYVDRFGGYVGVVTDAFGTDLPVSLEKWRHADPARTRLKIEIRYSPRRKP